MDRYLKRVFRFNAAHSNVTDDSNVHPHSFSVSLYTDFLESNQEKMLEEIVNDFLSGFSGCVLDELPFFEGVYPSIEEIGDRFYSDLKLRLGSIGINLYELGISDGPMVAYLVSDRIVLPNLNDNISGKNYSMLIKMIERIGE